MDAPISGGPQRAKDGTLTIMCGGSQPDFDNIQPILQCMGSNIKLMGPYGAGTAAKLVSTTAGIIMLQFNPVHLALLTLAQ